MPPADGWDSMSMTFEHPHTPTDLGRFSALSGWPPHGKTGGNERSRRTACFAKGMPNYSFPILNNIGFSYKLAIGLYTLPNHIPVDSSLATTLLA